MHQQVIEQVFRTLVAVTLTVECCFKRVSSTETNPCSQSRLHNVATVAQDVQTLPDKPKVCHVKMLMNGPSALDENMKSLGTLAEDVPAGRTGLFAGVAPDTRNNAVSDCF